MNKKNTFFKLSLTIILLLCAQLYGCMEKTIGTAATAGNINNIARNQNADQLRTGSGKLTVDDMLAQISAKKKKTIPKSADNYYLTLNYQVEQIEPNSKQIEHINTILDKLSRRKAYYVSISAGPAILKDNVKAATLSLQRSQSLDELLQNKIDKVNIVYDPSLPVGRIDLQFYKS